ncbi:MAG: TIGR00730 family Rossman fold protein [Verrucomicrobiae bacterium]|nr:TIGR00730 family Rossman fold protein [Verrucomicrobiae bacterium]
MPIRSVCVYSASSNAIDPAFFSAADELGALLAAKKWTLVFGGGKVGLMGEVARAVHRAGGRVVGVIPESLKKKEIAYDMADELVVTRTMRERKAIMDERADAFIALPGGFGTLEEIIEALTLKLLRYHRKPVVFLNTNGFYDPLLTLFDHIYEHRFAKAECRALYHVCRQPKEAVWYLEQYVPPPSDRKWF